MFKKFFITIAAFISLTASADPTIQYYSLIAKQSPHTPLVEMWVKNMNETIKVNWRSGLSCAGTAAASTDTSPKIIEFVAGGAIGSMANGDTLCAPDLSKAKYISLVEYSNEMCVRKDSKIKSIDDMKKAAKVTVAFPARIGAELWVAEFNKQYNANAKPVMTNISSTAMLALLAGDVDVGYLSIIEANKQLSAGTITCFATSNTNASNSLVKLVPKINPVLSSYMSMFPLTTVGVSDKDIATIRGSIARAIAKTEIPIGVTITVTSNDKEEAALRDYLTKKMQLTAAAFRASNSAR